MRRSSSISCFVAVLCSVFSCSGEEEASSDTAPGARRWTTPEILGESSIAYWVKPTIDARGNAFVVWDDLDGKVNAKRYDVRTDRWGPSEQLDPENPDDSAVPSLAIDFAGNAMACWQRQSQHDDMRSVWTARYDASRGAWAPAEEIAGSELVLAPQLAMDRAGNALLAFTRSEIGSPVMAAHFDVERQRWSAAEPLAAVESFGAGAPRVAMAPDGNGVAVWIDGDLDRSTVRAARYDAESKTWSGARGVGQRADMAIPSGVALNPSGEAVVVWTQVRAERSEVWSSRSASSRAAWSEPQRLNLYGKGDPISPRILLDDRGNALAVWSAHDGERSSVWANRYDAARERWTGAVPLDAGTYDALSPSAGVDAAGNILVVWTRKETARSSSWLRSYTAATKTWSAPAPLDPESNGRSEFVEVALMRDGRALAVWSRDGNRIVASRMR